jgi:hypothetical protein
MSSPTINLGGTSGSGSYPSLLDISNLIRSLINDSQAGITGTPGEGQIWTDVASVSPFVQPFINSAVRQIYRELRNIGAPTMIRDSVYVNGLTPVFGLNGFGVPDPAVQTFLSYGGYFDGNTMNNNLVLPADLLFPERVWERQNGTNDNFTVMQQPQFGLPSRPQFPTLGEWEWREDKINFVGSTQVRDLRLRYYAALPQFFSATLDFSSTYIPVLDSIDAIAYKGAVLYARMLGSPGLPDLINEAKEQMFQLKNQYTRRAQSIDYSRKVYQHSDNSTEQLFFLR